MRDCGSEVPGELERALHPARDAGKRHGDPSRLQWSDVDGDALHLTQSKMGARVHILCTNVSCRMWKATERTSPCIPGKACGPSSFAHANDPAVAIAWKMHMQAAGSWPKPFDAFAAKDKRMYLHFNSLARTSVTRLAKAEATVPQIVSITEHALPGAPPILWRCLTMTGGLSKAAVIASENVRATDFANRLQARAV